MWRFHHVTRVIDLKNSEISQEKVAAFMTPITQLETHRCEVNTALFMYGEALSYKMQLSPGSYLNVTNTSHGDAHGSWRLKSPATGLFVQFRTAMIHITGPL